MMRRSRRTRNEPPEIIPPKSDEEGAQPPESIPPKSDEESAEGMEKGVISLGMDDDDDDDDDEEAEAAGTKSETSEMSAKGTRRSKRARKPSARSVDAAADALGRKRHTAASSGDDHKDGDESSGASGDDSKEKSRKKAKRNARAKKDEDSSENDETSSDEDSKKKPLDITKSDGDERDTEEDPPEEPQSEKRKTKRTTTTERKDSSTDDDSSGDDDEVSSDEGGESETYSARKPLVSKKSSRSSGGEDDADEDQSDEPSEKPKRGTRKRTRRTTKPKAQPKESGNADDSEQSSEDDQESEAEGSRRSAGSKKFSRASGDENGSEADSSKATRNRQQPTNRRRAPKGSKSKPNASENESSSEEDRKDESPSSKKGSKRPSRSEDQESEVDDAQESNARKGRTATRAPGRRDQLKSENNSDHDGDSDDGERDTEEDVSKASGRNRLSKTELDSDNHGDSNDGERDTEEDVSKASGRKRQSKAENNLDNHGDSHDEERDSEEDVSKASGRMEQSKSEKSSDNDGDSNDGERDTKENVSKASGRNRQSKAEKDLDKHGDSNDGERGTEEDVSKASGQMEQSKSEKSSDKDGDSNDGEYDTKEDVSKASMRKQQSKSEKVSDNDGDSNDGERDTKEDVSKPSGRMERSKTEKDSDRERDSEEEVSKKQQEAKDASPSGLEGASTNEAEEESSDDNASTQVRSKSSKITRDKLKSTRKRVRSGSVGSAQREKEGSDGEGESEEDKLSEAESSGSRQSARRRRRPWKLGAELVGEEGDSEVKSKGPGEDEPKEDPDSSGSAKMKLNAIESAGEDEGEDEGGLLGESQPTKRTRTENDAMVEAFKRATIPADQEEVEDNDANRASPPSDQEGDDAEVSNEKGDGHLSKHRSEVLLKAKVPAAGGEQTSDLEQPPSTDESRTVDVPSSSHTNVEASADTPAQDEEPQTSPVSPTKDTPSSDGLDSTTVDIDDHASAAKADRHDQSQSSPNSPKEMEIRRVPDDSQRSTEDMQAPADSHAKNDVRTVSDSELPTKGSHVEGTSDAATTKSQPQNFLQEDENGPEDHPPASDTVETGEDGTNKMHSTDLTVSYKGNADHSVPHEDSSDNGRSKASLADGNINQTNSESEIKSLDITPSANECQNPSEPLTGATGVDDGNRTPRIADPGSQEANVPGTIESAKALSGDKGERGGNEGVPDEAGSATEIPENHVLGASSTQEKEAVSSSTADLVSGPSASGELNAKDGNGKEDTRSDEARLDDEAKQNPNHDMDVDMTDVSKTQEEQREEEAIFVDTTEKPVTKVDDDVERVDASESKAEVPKCDASNDAVASLEQSEAAPTSEDTVKSSTTTTPVTGPGSKASTTCEGTADEVSSHLGNPLLGDTKTTAVPCSVVNDHDATTTTPQLAPRRPEESDDDNDQFHDAHMELPSEPSSPIIPAGSLVKESKQDVARLSSEVGIAEETESLTAPTSKIDEQEKNSNKISDGGKECIESKQEPALNERVVKFAEKTVKAVSSDDHIRPQPLPEMIVANNGSNGRFGEGVGDMESSVPSVVKSKSHLEPDEDTTENIPAGTTSSDAETVCESKGSPRPVETESDRVLPNEGKRPRDEDDHESDEKSKVRRIEGEVAQAYSVSDPKAPHVPSSTMPPGNQDKDKVRSLLCGYDRKRLNRVKTLLYFTGSRVHHGRGFERIFAEYWDAVTLRLSDRLSSHTSERCERAVKVFLKSARLKKLHNRFIMSLMKRAAHLFVPFDEISKHVPVEWNCRIQQIAKAHSPVMFEDNLSSTLSQPTKTKAINVAQPETETIYRETWLSCAEETPETSFPFLQRSENEFEQAKTQSVSSEIPGALAVDPLVRDIAADAGMRVAENAVWLLVVALKEYTTNTLKTAISHRESLENGQILPRTLRYPNVLASSKNIGKRDGTPEKALPSVAAEKQQSTVKRLQSAVKRLTALDVYAGSGTVPSGSIGSLGGSISRSSLERSLYSAYDSLPALPGNDFVKVQKYLSAEIESLALKRKLEPPVKVADEAKVGKSVDAQTVDPPSRHHSAPKAVPKPLDDKPSVPAHPVQQTAQVHAPAKVQESATSQNSQSLAAKEEAKMLRPVVRGLGRGAKNLAALMRRAATSTPPAQPSTDKGPATPPASTSTSAQPNPGSTTGKPLTPGEPNSRTELESATTELSTNKEEEVSQTREAPKDGAATPEEPDGPARRGKGFGVKNLRALMARSAKKDQPNDVIDLSNKDREPDDNADGSKKDGTAP